MNPTSTQSTRAQAPILLKTIRENGLVLTDYVHIAVATISITFLSLAVPIMTLQVYDRVLENPDAGTLPVLVTGVVLALLIEAGIRLGRSFIVQHASAIFEHKMNCKLFFHSLYSDVTRKPDFDAGAHLQRFSSVGDVKDDFTGASFVTICETIMLPVFYCLLIVIAKWLTIVPALVCVLYMIAALIISRNLKQAVEKRDELDSKRYSFLVNTLAGVHTIKAFAAEKIFERRYEAQKASMGEAHYKVARLNATLGNLGTFFSGLMTVSVVAIGAFMVITKIITVGSLIATIVITGRVMGPVQKIVGYLIRRKEVALAYDDLEDMLSDSQKVDISTEFQSPDQAIEDHEARGHLSVCGLHFRFDDGSMLFDELDFEILPKEMVTIGGGFGCGKSTLLRLFCGVHAPQAGQIMLDDRLIENYTQKSLTRHVGLVESAGVLFRGTIRDNITRFGLTPDGDAQDATRLLELDREIIKLPSGFETVLSGKKNDVIQPDLCQRIAIARTLAMKPRLLLLDEPNRNLDVESYNVLFRVLARLKGHISIILVSNDKNLNSLSDRLYTIDNKKLLKA